MNHIEHSFTFLAILKVLKNIYFRVLNRGHRGEQVVWWLGDASGGGCGSISSDDAAAADGDNFHIVIIWPFSGPAKHM
jgi:hypothetical protein